MNLSAITGDAFVQAYLLTLLATYSMYVVLRAGVYSIATVGFMGIGAYTTAILTVNHGWPAMPAVLAGILVAMVVGAVLGRLIEKLRGAYQAIATLAFVMIVQTVAFAWTNVTGGYLGIVGIPLWATTTWLVILAVVVAGFCVALELSKLGRRQRAAFHDEIAAASIGINVASNKFVAVVVSAGLGGLAGAAQAGNQFVVDSTIYGFSLVITVLSCIVIGGSRSFLGPIVGTFVVVALPLVFSSYATFASIVVAVVTLVIMLFLPRGIVQVVPIDASRVTRWLRKPPSVDSLAERESPSERFAPQSRSSRDPLVARKITRSFGAVKAVSDVSLEVQPGQVVGLIGPNGAGKTTALNLIAGVSLLDEGTITVGDKRIETLPSYKVEREGVARTFQTCRLFAEATVWENVLLAASSGRSRARRNELNDARCALAALELAGCLEDVDRIATELPYSHQRRVEIARALATEPKFILLDEPAAGMPESEADALADIVRGVAARGIGVLVIDHNVSWICSISSRVLVQNFGSTIADGPPDEIINNPVVISAYIGAEDDHTAAEVGEPAGAVDA
ncbi:ATP-binding cassette domain-containing protein [Nocardioides humi]|uniref:Branched-chain amino acid ABC transporter ATP-binding protein/permease n=1 Tax=Nocardioides humi TaxID=449461 RepID=A0ABN2B4D5_9ACTN|nr:branched-chain amino acid ABC transporter ATP-binding protein/permease [Nocardioides humi]